jgi:hypothetical protein
MVCGNHRKINQATIAIITHFHGIKLAERFEWPRLDFGGPIVREILSNQP